MEERKGYVYLNEVRITGRLTDAVSYKKFEKGEKGGSVAEFTIAHNRRWKPKESEDWKESTSFFRVKAYNGLAEKIKEKFRKGDFVLIEGRLQEESWENEEGQKRSLIKIIAENAYLVFPYQKEEDATGGELNEERKEEEKEEKVDE
jgi:single-strand DNA-binding protein